MSWIPVGETGLDGDLIKLFLVFVLAMIGILFWVNKRW